MDYNKADVKIIAEHLKWIKNHSYSTAILIGAGMSVSAGIPAAKNIVKEVKRQFPNLSSSIEKETYPATMGLFAPGQRKAFISSFIDNAKINLAHLYLGALVKEGYVDRILTTNFDPLVVRSLALFNIFPAVYDFAASQIFIPGEAAQLSVFHLHGQRDGFVILNTDDEINRHYVKLKDVFQDVNRGRCWIIIGYSGENDPVFKQLAEIDVFQHKLFWINHSEKEPAEHVFEGVLSPKNRFGYYVKNYDADKFFLELARELNLPEPDIISKPFSHLNEAINTITEFPIEDKWEDPLKETKKWVNAAIKGFEKGEGFEGIKDVKKIEIEADEYIRKTRNIWVHRKFNEINPILEEIKSRGIEEANKFLAFGFFDWGITLSDLANAKEGEEAEELFRQAFGKYEKAIEMKSDFYEAFNNWGTALSDFAMIKEGEEAEELFRQAFGKYEKAIEIKPDYHKALYNWGNALSNFARIREGEEAERLFRQAFGKYEKVLEIKPDNQNALYNFGNALSDFARIKEGEEAEESFRQAFVKYEKAIEIKSDFYEAFNNWGTALSDLASMKEGEEAEELFGLSFEKYEKAIEMKSDFYEAFNNWGIALVDFARMKEKEEAEELFRLAFGKYEKAIKIKSDFYEAFNNWGTALSDFARMKGGKEAEELFRQSLEKYMKAEEIKEGSASYNIAVLYSLSGNSDKSLIWLKKSLTMNMAPPKSQIIADSDLDNIKGEEDFKKIIR